MGWFWSFCAIIVFLSFGANGNYQEGKKKKVPSAVVIVGTVYCDTCFHHYPNNFIAGATVAVECSDTNLSPNSNLTFRQQVITNTHGEFKVHLPPSIGKHVKKIKKCSVRLVSSNHHYCAVSATATSSLKLNLKSRKNGTHIFSAGFFTFKPLEQPQLCDQKPSIDNIKEKNLPLISHPNNLSFAPPIQDPDPPNLGEWLPRLPPLPALPRLPPLPGFPLLPPGGRQSENAVNRPMDLPLPQNPPLGIPPILPLPSLPPPVPGSPPSPVSVPGFLGVPPVEVPAPTSFP